MTLPDPKLVERAGINGTGETWEVHTPCPECGRLMLYQCTLLADTVLDAYGNEGDEVWTWWCSLYQSDPDMCQCQHTLNVEKWEGQRASERLPAHMEAGITTAGYWSGKATQR